VAPDNNQKRQEYDDQVIRTFYLSNAAVKDVFALLRGLIDARNIAQNDALNAITIKDTPERIAVAERIIRANDKAKGEVLVNVELLEINSTRLREFGPQLSAYAIGQQLDVIDGSAISEGDEVRLHELDLLKKEYNWILGPFPSLSYQMLKSTSDAHILAQPQLRVTDGEKAKVHIGDNVPIPGTQFLGIGTGGGQTVRNFTYQPVGIQIEVQPRVHHNKEITLTLNVEVSSIAAPGSGDIPPTIGTRNISTVIRLMDGQVNLLAGLIRSEDRDSLSTVPGLGDLPLLRRLFGASRREKRETDIVLSLNPHIIRMPNITASDLKPLWVGYGDRIRLLEVPPPSEIIGKGETEPDDRVKKSPPKKEKPKEEAAKKPPVEEERADAAPPVPEALQGISPQDAAGEAVLESTEAESAEGTAVEEEGGAETEEAPVFTPTPFNVRITPQTFVSAKDEAIELGVFLSGVKDLFSMEMEFTWNPAILEVTDIENSTMMGQQNAKVLFERGIDQAAGKATLSLRRAEVSFGAQGTGRLLTIRVTGKAVGTSAMFMSRVEAKNSQDQPVQTILSHAKVQVVE
jgi:general secretion pathway protein D